MPEQQVKKKRVLVVEDEKNIAMLLAYNLMQAGYGYDVACDGEGDSRRRLPAGTT